MLEYTNRRTPRAHIRSTTDATGISVCSVQPEVASFPVAAVDRHVHPLAVPGDRLVEELEVAERGCAEHDACGAGLDRRLDRLDRTQAAPDLDRHIDRARDPPDVLEVRGLAAAGAVEVDDVERPGTAGDPAPGSLAAGPRRRPSSAAKSPLARRTALPSKMSIAGRRIMRRRRPWSLDVPRCSPHRRTKLPSIRRP